MSSRERVLAAIKHELPDRIPISVGGITRPLPFGESLDLASAAELPEIGSGEFLHRLDKRESQAFAELQNALELDLFGVMPPYVGPEPAEGTTCWGTNFQGPFDAGYSQSRETNPLENAITLSDVENFPWPSPESFDYSELSGAAEALGDRCRMLSIGWEPVFNRVLDLFGMEEAMARLCLQPKFIEAAVVHIEAYVLAKAEKALQAAAGQIDIFAWGDDFATHRGLFISPKQWRRFFAPSYRALIELVKSYGVKFLLHCCGTFVDVLPDLVDMGIDIWHPCQVHLPDNDPEYLKSEFGPHITFNGAVNTQHTVPFGSVAEVRQEVRERIAVLGRGGGYICGPDHDVREDVPVDNLLALLDEAKNYRNPSCVRA